MNEHIEFYIGHVEKFTILCENCGIEITFPIDVAKKLEKIPLVCRCGSDRLMTEEQALMLNELALHRQKESLIRLHVGEGWLVPDMHNKEVKSGRKN